MPHKFDAKNAEILDSPDRIQFLNPESILDKLGLQEDEAVEADGALIITNFSINLDIPRCKYCLMRYTYAN